MREFKKNLLLVSNNNIISIIIFLLLIFPTINHIYTFLEQLTYENLNLYIDQVENEIRDIYTFEFYFDSYNFLIYVSLFIPFALVSPNKNTINYEFNNNFKTVINKYLFIAICVSFFGFIYYYIQIIIAYLYTFKLNNLYNLNFTYNFQPISLHYLTIILTTIICCCLIYSIISEYSNPFVFYLVIIFSTAFISVPTINILLIIYLLLTCIYQFLRRRYVRIT